MAKAHVADMMEQWADHNLTMRWAPAGYALNNGPLFDWTENGGNTPQPLSDQVYNCFEAVFLAAAHSMEADRAQLNAIYHDAFPTFQSHTLVNGPLRAYRSSASLMGLRAAQVPERGDIVIFGDNCDHVVLATGNTVDGMLAGNEAEVVSFWASHTGAGSAPGRVTKTTIEALLNLFSGLQIPSTVQFGNPRW